MPRFVEPKVFYLGATATIMENVEEYLRYTKRLDFLKDWRLAKSQGISDAECMLSLFAKLCYKSVVLGENDNLTKIRPIKENLESVIETAHLSILEHVHLNFIATDVSRVFTHEFVRNRIGFAFAQTSGRYCRGDVIDFVHDPILDEIKDDIFDLLVLIEERYNQMVKKMGLDGEKDFEVKKAKTSALRRVLPNGQGNEMAFSVNLRALRHTIQLRTSRHAEREIRNVYGQVYTLIQPKYPLMFADAKATIVKGLLEVSGMKMQPYEL